MSLVRFRPSAILTGVSRRRYRLIEQVQTAPHVWFAKSLNDDQKVVIKSPLRNDPQLEDYTRHELKQEIILLCGPFKGQPGIRQLVDRIRLVENPEQIDAAVLEYGEMSLDDVHFVAKRPLTSNQVKSIARQLLQALASMHERGIVHTDIKPQNIVFTRLPDGFNPDLEVKLTDVGTESEEERQDNWLRSVNALFPFPEPLLERAPKAMQLKLEAFSKVPPRLPDGRIVTSSLLKELYGRREYDWKFVETILNVDPEQ
ncbi:hypothetical protein MMC26_001656 [Xylographa opegraphella]|nr:hypothetical protein [Xylographa opegraphella]